MNFSVCIITNKINSIFYKCITSFIEVADEICVGVNGIEKEELKHFAHQFPTIKIFELNWKGYGATKNELASKATHDWILSIDSDELCSDELKIFLRKWKPANKQTVYAIRRKNFLKEREIKYGSWGKTQKFVNRLYNKHHTRWNERKVHEDLIVDNSMVEYVNESLHHFTAENLQEVRTKNDAYALLGAQHILQKNKKGLFLKSIFSPIMAFVKPYFLLRGFMDGRLGWDLAKENARYTFRKYNLIKKLRAQKNQA